MRKKVGILSMQRVINYGSYLQAYALKKLLLQEGADSVEFIDIVPGRSLPGLAVSGLSYYYSRFKAMMKVLLSGNLSAKKRTLAYRAELASVIRGAWPALGLQPYPMNPSVDLAVIGSDEVFHCCQKTRWGFTPQLYGAISTAKEVVSYAGSFGATKLVQLRKLGIDEEIRDQMKKLAYISVRDENSRNIVTSLTGITPYLHIDPVLAYGYKQELEEIEPVDEENYILIYSYPDRIRRKDEIESIVNFAKSRGKKLISIMSKYDWCDRAITPTPLEMLAWFKYADIVITETFHGTIFSIITERQFVTIGRATAMTKLTSMLQPYGLETRLYSQNRRVEEILQTQIDYNHVNKVLEILRAETHSYLQTILN